MGSAYIQNYVIMQTILDLRSSLELNDDQFAKICRHNPDLKFERTAKGELVIVALTGGNTGRRNLKLSGRLLFWIESTGNGEGFDSSTGFKLPNGSIRSPDVAWVSTLRWQDLTPEQQKRIVPLCPDFVVELRFASDDPRDLQKKMQDYIDNGLKLGWLLDPETKIVEIYRFDQAVEILNNPDRLSGEEVLPGFVLDLNGIL